MAGINGDDMSGLRGTQLRDIKMEFGKEFKKQLKTLLVAAFGFVAALSWNDAIKSLVASYIPAPQSQWPYLIANAVAVTVFAVVVMVLIAKFSKD